MLRGRVIFDESQATYEIGLRSALNPRCQWHDVSRNGGTFEELNVEQGRSLQYPSTLLMIQWNSIKSQTRLRISSICIRADGLCLLHVWTLELHPRVNKRYETFSIDQFSSRALHFLKALIALSMRPGDSVPWSTTRVM